jgi:formamidopyrimidine-DNA glycosylase
MPELPEVEVTRQSFADRIAGARILALHMGKALRWPLGCDPQKLSGRRVIGVRRRGKYLLLDLDEGLLLLHLGMAGSLRFEQAPGPAGKHDHMDLATNQGTLRLHDPRRFGAVVFVPNESSPAAGKLLGKLGVEPLGDDFQAPDFWKALKKRKTVIKQLLLAGELVVGVGNIYASEALFMAGIRPSTRAERISLARATRLHAAIRTVLARAVAIGGSTLKDFSNAKGESGYFQLEAAVYGRQGLPCRACGSAIKAIRQGQRSTFFCPVCQKP